jgi:hypothetical protein
VFSNRKWTQAALILNLLGTVALFYSFQATSSNFRLVTVKTDSPVAGQFERSALCIYGHTMIEAGSERGVWSIGGGPCPDWEHSKAAAVVNIEHPMFESLGFTLVLMGFALQYFSVPQPKTVAQMREELKRLKAEEKRSKSI